jgi:hypothetical protein
MRCTADPALFFCFRTDFVAHFFANAYVTKIVEVTEDAFDGVQIGVL